MKIILAIFLGGGLGSIARYGVSKLITSNFQNINPVGTLISNLVSTAILGLIVFSSLKNDLPHTIKLMIVVGFCGGFSTFSTFSFETIELMRTGSYLFAAANIIISLLLGLTVLYVLSKTI